MKEKNITRRDFLRLSGLATAGVIITACGQAAPPAAEQPAEEAAAPTTAPAAEAQEEAAEPTATTASEAAAPEAGGGLADVAREKTLVMMWGGVEGQFTTVGLTNPYNPGNQPPHRQVHGAFEPLFFYSAFADEVVPWLATGAEYNDDFTELVVNIREGAEWSDGTPFTARDVAFTLNMLKANAPAIRNSTEVAAWVKEATAVDDLTAKIVFNEPRPRFLFSHLYGKFDTGIAWVPEHVFKDVEDVAAFTNYDLEKGWPLVTGPFNVVEWRPEQQIIDRRADWWAAKIGFAELPEIERILILPWSGEERAAQLIINNEIDTSLDLRATTIIQTVAQNPQIITHTNKDLPLGYTDWWPTSLWFNTSEPPYDTKETRWAVSYSIDRQQMLDVALEGSGILTQLPFPYYPPLQPYIDAAQPLLEKYPTNEYNPDKAAELMQGQGYEKDGEGFWVKDGARVEALIHGFGIFNDIGPVLAEQLRRNGFEAEYTAPADAGTKMGDGTAKIFLFGHGGSIADPFDTLDFYTSKYYVPTGEPAQYFSRWQNAEYDVVLEEMAKLAPNAEDPAYMELYLQAMEMWLDNLVDCPIQQWLHRIPMNTTYWDNWPTTENNYVNGAFWHQTFGLILQNLKAKA